MMHLDRFVLGFLATLFHMNARRTIGQRKRPGVGRALGIWFSGGCRIAPPQARGHDPDWFRQALIDSSQGVAQRERNGPAVGVVVRGNPAVSGAPSTSARERA
jgi:hypothetical protein